MLNVQGTWDRVAFVHLPFEWWLRGLVAWFWVDRRMVEFCGFGGNAGLLRKDI